MNNKSNEELSKDIQSLELDFLSSLISWGEILSGDPSIESGLLDYNNAFDKDELATTLNVLNQAKSDHVTNNQVVSSEPQQLS